MKKHLLLLFALLAIAGMTVAQDIWSVGYSINSTTNKKVARLYKNGSCLSYVGTDASTNDYEGVGVVNHDGATYYAVNGTGSNGSKFAVIYNRVESAPYLGVGNNTQINALFHRLSLYAAGYYTVDGKKVACTWKNNNSTPEYVMGDASYDSEALCGMFPHFQGLYTGGYQYTSGSAYHGVIWKNNAVLYEFDENTKIVGIYYYGGDVFSLGFKEDNNGCVVSVNRNNNLLYTLNSSAMAKGFDIFVDAGDIYVVGYEGVPCKVWKNGSVLYEHNIGNTGYLTSVWVNSNGLYYVGKDSNDQGLIYKDGEVIYTPSNCVRLNAIYMDPLECADGDVRTLPYFEGFEMGDTDWECWTKNDVDNNNAGGYPFWQRWGQTNVGNPVHPYEGDYCAKHGWGAQAQEGWLISPKFFLQPGRDNTTLTFMSNEASSGFNDYRGIWISTSDNNTSSFTEIATITNPSDDWHQVNVDLSAYQGETIYLAFKYTGTNGIGWTIDNIELTESWAPCNDFTEFPYEEHFDSHISWCWYRLDNDHTGDMRCWEYNESNRCAWHVWGPSTVNSQEGWLFSPRIQLTAGQNYTLNFLTKAGYPAYADESSVWIALDKTSVPDPADYTKIWEETDFNDLWESRTIDLSAYAGHTVNIAFKYGGQYAHSWYLDDVVVTAAVPQYNINAESNNTAYGTVDGGGTYDQGATCLLTATANTGYEFKKWTKDGEEVSTNASYSFEVTENATYVGVFGEPSITYYTISTEANPLQGGSVDGGDTYAEGTSVVLTAIPNTGWHFVKWQDNDTDNPRTITVNGDATYTAYFERDTHILTVTANPSDGGTVTGGGTYNFGQTATLTATPNTDYEFLNWNDGVTASSRTVTVVEDASYVAYFVNTTTTTYTIGVVANDPTKGTVTGGGVYPEGAEISLTASPYGINVFTHWNDGNTNNPRTITVTGDAVYTAFFETPTLYTITVQSQNPTMGTVSGGGNFAAGSEISIQATPNGGYYFDGWTDGNYENPRTVTVTGNATYVAKFTSQQSQNFMLTATCNPAQGAVTGNGTYPAGTTVTVEAIPYAGFVFDHWNDGNKQNPRTVTINSNMTLVAFFSGTGVEEYGESALSLYPNPAKETLRIVGLNQETEAYFYNSLGMLVMTVSATADEEINVSQLASGLYLIRCGNQMMRFVKE